MIFTDLIKLITENQLEAIILMLLCILFGYVLGRLGIKIGVKRAQK